MANKNKRAKHIEKLKKELSKIFPANKFRIDLMALFIITLIQVCTINLTKIAAAFPGKAKIESHYKRLQRFFSLFEFSEKKVVELIIGFLPMNKFDLSIDRTNWRLGKIDINILMIGIVYKGVCFPLTWSFLEKKGNSNTAERIELMNRCVNLVGKENVSCLLADREFVGKEWFKYLIDNGIAFNIRIKDNFVLDNGKPIKNLFRNVKLKKAKILRKKRLICGNNLYLSGTRIEGDYLIVATPKKSSSALNDYAKRWEIETLFGCLKTRGFNFEDTHLTKPKRINTLLVLLSITFCWAHLVGEWLHDNYPIRIKKHGRPAKSIFRYGLDFLKNILFDISNKFDSFVQVLRLLSCT